MNMRLATLGGLTCRIVDELPDGQSPTLAVVFCHGFGAPGTDLVPLGPELLELEPSLSESVRFIFPEAPLSLEEYGYAEGRAWWPIDMLRLQMAIETGRIRELRGETPPGLAQAADLLRGLVEDVCRTTGLPLSRLVLGGFSQGAMLATEVTLRLPELPAALVILSGTLLCEEKWRELAAKRGKLIVFQSHGTTDPLLPFENAVCLRDLLTESGCEVEFLAFRGPHTIPTEALLRLGELLKRLAIGG